ncbi:Retrovirus-related Pol polyprotein from transposon TNT 1-94, partial [Stegodyphus mimosarum]
MEAAKISVKPLCGKSDWPIWKYRIKFVLNYHENALEVVEGKLKKPVEPDHAAEEIRKRFRDDMKVYNKANNCAMMVLTNSMTEDTLQKVMRFESARDIWLELHKVFEDSSDNQLYNICLQFFKFSWSSDDMAAHLSKLKNLWNELNSGLENKEENRLPEMLLICKILDTLPPSYRTFKSSWLLLSDEKRTLDELTTQLCTHERELRKDPNFLESLDQEALIANSEFKRKSSINKKNNGKCNYCHQRGHWVRTCKKWIADGKPPKPSPRTGPNKGTKNIVAANMTLLAVDEAIFSAETNSDDWFIDNGASKHVVNNSHYFIDFERFKLPHSITVANGKSLPAIGKGTIKIMTIVNGMNQIKNLENVWYVPEISKNLFSVLASQDRNQNSVFESTFKDCYLKIDGEIVLHGTRNAGGGLFKAVMKTLVPETHIDINVTENNESTLQLYHERWGHQDKRHVKAIVEKELNIKIKSDMKLCKACVYGKSHRLKFGTRKEHKSEVKDVLENFIADAKNLGHKVKEILSDNGGEFDNEAVRKILNKQGISQRLTAPYTPEQNGSAEREIRTVLEMARTLEYSNEEVDFPTSLWAEFVSTSVYILNRTGKSSVPNLSLYELWVGRKPRIKHMRIIGSTCYVHIPVQKRRKMDKKATKGYLLGYDGDERYRIYIKETSTVICSRDVIFEEKPSMTGSIITLPLQQVSERDSSQDDEVENKVIDEGSQQEKKEVEDIPEKESRPRRQISAPKWTKDYIMENSEIYEENLPEINGITSGMQCS